MFYPFSAAENAPQAEMIYQRCPTGVNITLLVLLTRSRSQLSCPASFRLDWLGNTVIARKDSLETEIDRVLLILVLLYQHGQFYRYKALTRQ